MKQLGGYKLHQELIDNANKKKRRKVVEPVALLRLKVAYIEQPQMFKREHAFETCVHAFRNVLLPTASDVQLHCMYQFFNLNLDLILAEDYFALAEGIRRKYGLGKVNPFMALLAERRAGKSKFQECATAIILYYTNVTAKLYSITIAHAKQILTDIRKNVMTLAGGRSSKVANVVLKTGIHILHNNTEEFVFKDDVTADFRKFITISTGQKRAAVVSVASPTG